MQVEERRISQIKPYEKNPRVNDHAVGAVTASIREFGFRQPIVVDEQGVRRGDHGCCSLAEGNRPLGVG